MKKMNRATIQEFHWKDIRDEVSIKNPVLAKIIDALDPSDEYTLFKASYPFGTEILKGGLLFVPNMRGKLAPINSPEISSSFRDKLNYNLNANPVTLMLNHAAEMFIVNEDNSVPIYGWMTPGELFGAWHVLCPQSNQHPAFIWDMTAGARSIFMLPKISESTGYNKLCQAFHVQASKPQSLLDHWKLFKEIANHADFGEKWTADMLFFSKKWFENLNDPQWLSFKNYLFETAWRKNVFFQNQFIWDLVISLIHEKRKIKPSAFLVNSLKHLFAIGIGALPGFAVARDDIAAPVQRIQEIFTTIYQLEGYAPIIMQPHLFSLEDQHPVYYSLQYPTALGFSPKTREGSTKIFNLYEMKQLLSKYLADIHSNKLNVKNTLIYNACEKVSYDFFHTDPENYAGIRSSKVIPLEDAAFTQWPKAANKIFPVNSAFLRGCIRINAKEDVAYF